MRRVLCLLLVICLLVPLFPVPSSAVGTGAAVAAGTWLAADGIAKIAATLIGIGLTAKVIDDVVHSDVFDKAVSSVKYWAKSNGYLDSSDKINVYKNGDTLYLPYDFIAGAKDSLIKSNYIQPPAVVPNQYSCVCQLETA